MIGMKLRETPQGVTLQLKVKPKAKQNAVLGARGDTLLVAVTAAPEKGKANQACMAVLAELFKIPKGNIEIVSGETHPQKVILIKGMTVAQVQDRLSL